MQRIFAASTQIGGVDFPWSPARSFPTIASLVSTIAANIFVFGGVIAFIFVIAGGFGIIIGANSGDPKRMEQGKQTLTMAVVGLLVIFFSFWIVQLVGLLLGFDPLKFNN